MQTLTYTTNYPENNDPASVWWPAMAANAAQFDAHTHDGVTSAPLKSVIASAVTTQLILSTAWGSDLGGSNFRQLITLPVISGVQLLFDSIQISMRLTSNGNYIFPSIEKVSSTTYYVYTPDSSLAYTAVYTT